MTIKTVKCLNVGTTETVERAASRTFLIQNAGTSNIFFKEKAHDGSAADSANGFVIFSDQTLPIPICAETLSLISSQAGGKVNILYLE